jgi:hypothetical protein
MPRSVVLVIGSLLWALVAYQLVAHAIDGKWLTDAILLGALVAATIAIRLRDAQRLAAREPVVND